jgi:hypothetical protein
MYVYIVRSRSLWEHTLKKLIKITISVREGVWGLIYEFEGTSGGPCRELNFVFESPPVNAACSLLLLFLWLKQWLRQLWLRLKLWLMLQSA